MARIVQLLFLVVAGAMVVGCGGDATTVAAGTTPTGPSTTSASPGEGASTTGIQGSGSPEGIREVPGPTAQRLLSRLVIYFEFDQSDIDPEFNALRPMASISRVRALPRFAWKGMPTNAAVASTISVSVSGGPRRYAACYCCRELRRSSLVR